MPTDPINYLLQSNQLTKGHSHLPIVKLTQFNQSISLPSLSIDEYLNCGASLKVPVGFVHISKIDLCINV